MGFSRYPETLDSGRLLSSIGPLGYDFLTNGEGTEEPHHRTANKGKHNVQPPKPHLRLDNNDRMC